MRKLTNRDLSFRGLKRFSVYDLVLLAMLTGLSIAFKTLVGILVRMITGPLGIPGGALAGGFYMMWLPLAIMLTGHRGSAFIIAAVQTIIMVTTGAPGSHGVWTIFTYLSPAILVEIVYLYRPRGGYNILHFLFATALANMMGTYGSNLLFFRMAWQPLLFTLLGAFMSGAIGGVIAYFAFKGVEKTGILKKARSKVKSVIYYKYQDLEYIYEKWKEKESVDVVQLNALNPNVESCVNDCSDSDPNGESNANDCSDSDPNGESNANGCTDTNPNGGA